MVTVHSINSECLRPHLESEVEPTAEVKGMIITGVLGACSGGPASIIARLGEVRVDSSFCETHLRRSVMTCMELRICVEAASSYCWRKEGTSSQEDERAPPVSGSGGYGAIPAVGTATAQKVARAEVEAETPSCLRLAAWYGPSKGP